MSERFAAVDAALDALAAVDWRSADHQDLGDAVVELHRLQSRLDAEVTRATGAFDTHGDPEGALTTPAYVAWRCKIPRPVAKCEVTNARALRSMPVVEAAFAAGKISEAHVRLLAAAHRASPEAFEKYEEELVSEAHRLRYEAFRRRVQYFRQQADPDGVEEEALDAFERRGLHASRTFEDTVQLDGLLDPVGGSVVLNELRRLEQELFEEDWREARSRLGDLALERDLRRTPAQRRADALVTMARRSAAMPADARQGRVLLTVLVGYETFAGRICQLADGTVVTPGQVVPLLTDADVERVVFDGPSRVVDVGWRRRLFTGATRRAVEVVHLECQGHESCEVAYERCEIDHIHPWEHGGPTNHDNGRPLCKKHHRRRRRRPRP